MNGWRKLWLIWSLIGIPLVIALVRPISGHFSGNAQQVAAFLQAPYYGTTSVTSIFDHDGNGGRILALTGVAAEANNCPCPDAPPGGCVDPDFTLGYYSCDIRGYLYYDNHRGIDYRLRYDYVRAAAPGRVEYAGWDEPANHRGVGSGLGLHVHIRHDNGYQTFYGHMSVLRVRRNDEIPINADEFQRILGIGGNTGWSSGPHLHFEVQNAAGVPVDPYGPDRNPDHKLWIERPSIAPHVIYTSGNRPLTAPPINENEPGAFTVDDGDTGFVENPAGCWTVDTQMGWAGDHRRRNMPAQNPGNCTATWNFPGMPGRYNVFVYVPNNHATTDAAQYTIRHAESSSRPWSKQSALARVNQEVYPNTYHPSSWVYVGTYYFNNQSTTDYVRLESAPLDPVADTMMAADAVRFAPVRYRTYLPLVIKRWPPIPDTPVLNPINNPNGSSGYTVSWQAADLASTYTLQEATNANFTGAATRYSGTGISWTASGKAAGTYYYRVKASNSWGDSGWSNIQQTTVWPSTTTFYSVADAMIRSGYPTSNYGSLSYMRAGYYSSYQAMRSLVRFDLTGIPSGTPIGQARLWLYMNSSYDPANVSRIIAVYRLTATWTESSVTWNTQPGFSSMYYNWVSIPHNTFGWYSVDVTNLMREWVGGQYPNYGIGLFGNESSTDQNWRGFSTREGVTDRRPYLSVVYGTGTSSLQSNAETMFISPLATPETPSDASKIPFVSGEVIPMFSPIPTPTLP